MVTSTRHELLRVLEQISSANPELRLGQLLVNLSYMARGPSVEAIWDAEDEELLRAAKSLLEKMTMNQASVA